MTEPVTKAVKEMVNRELMKTWREGMRDGLKIAAKIADAVQDECAKRLGAEDVSDSGRVMLVAQLDAISGLAAGIRQASEECMALSDGSTTVVNETSNPVPTEGDKS